MNWQRLQEIRDRLAPNLNVRLHETAAPPEGGPRWQVLICAGAGCLSSGADEFQAALERELEAAGIADQVRIVRTGCLGCCSLGPLATTIPNRALYVHLDPKAAPKIVQQDLLAGQTVEELLHEDPKTGQRLKTQQDYPFFKHQTKIVLEHCGVIDAESIDEYIGVGGYAALHQVLTTMTPEAVIDEVTKSGLRGRGGAGFPTGLKWKFVREAQGDEKFVVCNADEGDPGAFMDRSVLEGDPHRVLEGMAIAAYAIGNCRQGYIYVRAEYPLAIERLERAIAQAREYGLLGERLFETDFCFDVEIRIGAGAFVCGEETALLASLEGRRGQPRPKPPFPATQGAFGKPTLINNVETLANIPPILRNGGEWYASFGTEKSKGTKVFALAGKIQNTGLVEVEMGTPLRVVVEEIGGGIPDGRQFKAAQTGGPSGGCIPADKLDIPLDYESLQEIGAIVGSGGLIIMDDSSCMVDVAKFFMGFCMDESCGKCPPCRVGTRQVYEILDMITNGQGRMSDLELLEQLCHTIGLASLCGLGQTAPNPVKTTLRYFREEYEAHIRDKRCPAMVCRALIHYEIDPRACMGCAACVRACPAESIHPVGEKEIKGGKVVPVFAIDQEVCIHCGSCFDVCRFDAVLKLGGSQRLDQEASVP